MTQIIARGSKVDGSVNLYARLYKRPLLNKTVALGITLSYPDWQFIESILKNAEQAQKMGGAVVLRDSLAIKLWDIKNGLDSMIMDGTATAEYAKRYADSILREEVKKTDLPKEEQKQMLLVDWIEEMIRQCESGERLKRKSSKPVATSTIKKWKAFKRQVEYYQKSRHKVLGFDDITMDFYDDFKKFFIKKGYSPNSIAGHIKTLKIFLYAAKEMKLTTKTEFESSHFSVDFEEVENVYLTDERVQEMYQLDITDEDEVAELLKSFGGRELNELVEATEQKRSRNALESSKDVFVVGCLTGQRFSDYSRISSDMICVLRDGNEYIKLRQKKTGKDVYLPLDKRVKTILNKYGGKLPVVYEQKVNKHIKTIGHLLGWTEDAGLMERHGLMEIKSQKKFYECIKTHTARRTFATNAYKRGISLSSIMAVTGHSTEQMLRKYLKLDNKERAILAAAEFEKLKIAE